MAVFYGSAKYRKLSFNFCLSTLGTLGGFFSTKNQFFKFVATGRTDIFKQGHVGFLSIE